MKGPYGTYLGFEVSVLVLERVVLPLHVLDEALEPLTLHTRRRQVCVPH